MEHLVPVFYSTSVPINGSSKCRRCGLIHDEFIADSSPPASVASPRRKRSGCLLRMPQGCRTFWTTTRSHVEL